MSQFPNQTIIIKNEEYLYFNGTAYLGLPTQSEFQTILIKNILCWGSAYGSSRSANIQWNAYAKANIF